MWDDSGGSKTAFAVFFAIFALLLSHSHLQRGEIEWLRDLDDEQNFLTAGASSLSLYNLMTPRLGVMEPVTAIIRAFAAMVLQLLNIDIHSSGAHAFYILAAGAHAVNAALLSSLLQALHGNGKAARRAATLASLWWATHPLFCNEVLGWRSCDAYIYATTFCLASARRNLTGLTTSSFSSEGGERRGGLCLFCMACLCKIVVVTLPAAFVIVHAYRVEVDLRAPATSPKSAFFHASRFVYRILVETWLHWPFFFMAAIMIALTHAVNSSSLITTGFNTTIGEEQRIRTSAAVMEVTGVDANSGLFWAPVKLSRVGQLFKAVKAAAVWYPSRIIHPTGLRSLYLVPRAFSGVDEDAPVAMAAAAPNAIVDTKSVCQNFIDAGSSVSSVVAFFLAVSIFAAIAGGAITASLTSFASYYRQISSDANTSASSTHGIPRTLRREYRHLGCCATATLTGVCWAALLLPTVGFAGSHGFTLFAADRYSYLPGCFIAAPLVAHMCRLVDCHWGNGEVDGKDSKEAAEISDVVRDESRDGFGHENHQAEADKGTGSSRSNDNNTCRRRQNHRLKLLHRYRSYWVALLIAQSAMLLYSPSAGISKWRGSDHLWRREARPLSSTPMMQPTPVLFSWTVNNATMGVRGMKTAMNTSRLWSSERKYDSRRSWFYLFQRPDVLSLYNLGRRLQLNGALAEATVAYGEALRVDPTHGGAWNNLGSLLQVGVQAPSDIIRHLFENIDDGTSVQRGVDVGHFGDDETTHDANVIQGMHASATTMSEKTNGVISSTATVAATSTSKIMLSSDAAENCFRRAIALHPATHAKAHNNLARLLHLRGNFNSAEQSYRAAVRVSPLYYRAWRNLGLLLSQKEQQSFNHPPAKQDVEMREGVEKDEQLDALWSLRSALRAAVVTGESILEHAETTLAIAEILIHRSFATWKFSALEPWTAKTTATRALDEAIHLLENQIFSSSQKSKGDHTQEIGLSEVRRRSRALLSQARSILMAMSR